MNSKIDMDQTVNTNVESTDIYENGCIYIGAQSNSENQLKGAIAYKLTHYAIQILYSNFCKPFKKSDTLEENEFQNIVDVLQDLVFQQNSNGNSTLTNEFDDIIRLAFQCYDKLQWPAELIVRVNQMLAYYGFYEGEKLLNDQADNLLKYYRKYVMPHCENFLEGNYKFKPKAEIQNVNMSVGLVTKLLELSVKLGIVNRLLLTAGCKLLVLNTSKITMINLLQLVRHLSRTLKVKHNFKTVFVVDERNDINNFEKLCENPQNTLLSEVNLVLCDLIAQSCLLTKDVKGQSEPIPSNNYLYKPQAEIKHSNVSVDLVTEPNDLSVKFKDNFCIEFKQFIKSLDISFLLISTPVPLLTTNKVYQTLFQLKFVQNNYIVISYERYYRLSCIIDSLLLSASCKLLIVYTSNSQVLKWNKIITHLSEKLKDKPNFKTVVVANDANIVDVSEKLNSYYQYTSTLISDVNLAFNHLTVQSQHRLLLKEVEFQGEQIQFGKFVDENTKPFIKGNVLSKLILNQKN
ncbi:hypothetical protein CHUAL_006775 [Chamberlinius hualienensis]